MDLLADTLGIIIAYIVFRYVEKWLKNKK
jgi:hypothetical protein